MTGPTGSRTTDPTQAKVGRSGSTSFERLRPRTVTADEAIGTQTDNQGKRALFSTSTPKPAFGSVTVECSNCSATSVLSPAQAGRLLLTTLHAPGLRRHHVSWVRCPACGKRSWSRLRLRV